MDAMGGVHNRVLSVNLSTQKFEVLTIPHDIRKLYLGGKGLALWLLYNRLKPGVDPLSQENVIIFMTGPLCGTNAPSPNRFAVVAKSPLTGIIASSICGGPFGLELKRAGYDGLIIHGKSDTPVYISITDNSYSVNNATTLWGSDTFATQKKLEPEGKSAVIGPAGENMVRYACIVSGLRYAGRCGLGAVMGAKNLKAIVAHGSQKVEIAEPQKFKTVVKKAYQWIQQNIKTGNTFPTYGTPAFVGLNQEFGLLPTANFQSGRFEQAFQLTGEQIKYHHFIKNEGCIHCSIKCGRIGKYNDEVATSPEYETIGMLGPNLRIGNLNQVSILNQLCNRLGLDTISTGNVLGFAMELSERKIFDTGLQFGKFDNLPNVIEDIAYRRGFGNELADGVRQLSANYGGEQFAMHTKGLELPAYEPRACFGQGLAFATTNRGGCHLSGGTHPFEIINGFLDPYTHKSKPEFVVRAQNLYDAVNSSIGCFFTIFAFLEEEFLARNTPKNILSFTLQRLPKLSIKSIKIHTFPRLLTALLGYKISHEQYFEIGERIFNLERYMNTREGINSVDDTLPARCLKEPLDGNPTAIVPLDKMLPRYYKIRGWNSNGIPTEATLTKLKILTDLQLNRPHL